MATSQQTWIILIVTIFQTINAVPTKFNIRDATNQFGNAMYKSLAKESGNVFFSPYSVHLALSILYQGARGTTAQALANTLHVQDTSSTAEAYDALITRLNGEYHIQLKTANKVYVKEGIPFKQDFNKTVTEKLYSEVEHINFEQSDAAAQTINSWIERNTNGKIKKRFESDAISKNSRLVLANAVYFKSVWRYQFDPFATKWQEFHISDKESKQVDMMIGTNLLPFTHIYDLKAKILELPYDNVFYSMLLVLPDEVDGLAELESKLVNISVESLRPPGAQRVYVNIPKFKVSTSIDLQKTLTDLGLGIMFNECEADFTGLMDSHERVKVDKVVQKVYVEVNEMGAEAVATTRITNTLAVSTPIVREFIADHPFLVYLIGKSSGDIPLTLFQGRIERPEYD